MAALKVISVAVASGRAGFVVFDDRVLRDWGITVKAAKSPPEMAGFVQGLINQMTPDVVVTERCDEQSRKGRTSRALIQAIANTASHNYLLDVAVSRPRAYQSKYEEAEALAKRYPEVAGYLPSRKRRIFDFEPRGMILFEAIALAEVVINGPPEALAAAMG